VAGDTVCRMEQRKEGRTVSVTVMPSTDPSVHRDQAIHKGAMEEDRPGPDPAGAPGLDEYGLPNDATAIAQNALGANVDNTQG
jgi:hypothetical protein